MDGRTQSNKLPLYDRPLVAEIAGPSGAGKTTVSALLNEAGEDIRAGLTVWGIPISSLASSSLASIPDIARLASQRLRIDQNEVKQIVRLHAFSRQLKQRMKQGHQDALFLDEGVVFALAKLRADIGTVKMSQAMLEWERKMIERWSRVIDLVIWIDAPDELLLDRIRTRSKRHRMKDKPAAEVFRFLHNYRAAYRFVIEEMEMRGKTRVIKIDGAGSQPNKIAKRILACTLSARVTGERSAAAVGEV